MQIKHYLLALTLLVTSYFNSIEADTTVRFNFFHYQGKDSLFQQKFNPRREFQNPILSGF